MTGTMTLHLYNTLRREKQLFEPIDPGNVRMYVCGPTVYDYAHIGNARPAVVFDVLYRLLRHRFGPGHVTYVRNITDVDDKIIAAHRETGEPIESITERTAQAYWDDMHALGLPRSGRGAAGHQAHRRHGRDDRRPDGHAATPTRPRATCCSTCRPCPITARCPSASWTT